jgi:DNA-binding NarL/FixJ family response regulator
MSGNGYRTDAWNDNDTMTEDDEYGAATGNGSPRRPITVLIVDDERTFGEALELALSHEEDLLIVDVATDGTQAVRSADRLHPDVVLMDVAMPGMNGIEATRRIKEADPNARIVVLSGHDDEHLLARAVQAGATGMLRKTEAVVNVASTVRRAHRGERCTSLTSSRVRCGTCDTAATRTTMPFAGSIASRPASSRSSPSWRREASLRRSRRRSA